MDEGTHETIAVFPLANVVLFPKLRVPLYIFEPRYRQMVREALESDRRIGMVTVKPEHIKQTAGDPPVFSTGCEGVIIQSESLPDDCYNIVLQGQRRFRICSERAPEGERLYRLAEVEFLLEAPPRDAALNSSHPPDRKGAQPDTAVRSAPAAPAREAILELLHELLQQTQPASASAEFAAMLEGYDNELFVNSLAQSLSFIASEKQGLIECEGVDERLEHLLALLQFSLAASRSGQSDSARLQ